MSSDEFGKLQGPCETFDPKGIRRLFGIKRCSPPSRLYRRRLGMTILSVLVLWIGCHRPFCKTF